MPAERKVNRNQLNGLLDFIEQNRDIAAGQGFNVLEARISADQRWTELAKELNPMGQQRSPLYWKKYWHEMKYKVKMKLFKMRQSMSSSTATTGVPIFKDFELRLLHILGLELPPEIKGKKHKRHRKSKRIKKLIKLEKSENDNNSYEDESLNDECLVTNRSVEPVYVYENNAKSIKFDQADVNDCDNSYLRSSPRLFDATTSSDLSFTHGSSGDKLFQWAQNLEKSRIDSENRMSEAILALARSQSEMAASIRGIREDLQKYLNSKLPQNVEPNIKNCFTDSRTNGN